MQDLAQHIVHASQPMVSVFECTNGSSSSSKAKKEDWHDRYSSGSTRDLDLPAVFKAALQQRFAQAGHDAGIQFVPLQCLAIASAQAPSPRLGRFTLFNSAWAELGVRALQSTLLHGSGLCTLADSMCAKNMSQFGSFVARLVLLTVEFPAFQLAWRQSWPMHMATLQTFPYSAELQEIFTLVQIPYPSASHPSDTYFLAGFRPPEKRPSLVALSANAYTPLRQLLRAECERAGAPTCILSGGAARYGTGLWRNGSQSLAAYKDAIFCLQPHGDSATRKGLWDALSVGCINVVFHHEGWNGTDAWFGDHQEWSVALPLAAVGERGGVLELLRAIPSVQVNRLHASVLRVREKMQYSLAPRAGDAFNTIVERVAQTLDAVQQKEDGSSRESQRRRYRDRGRRACSAVRGFCSYAQTIDRSPASAPARAPSGGAASRSEKK